MEKPKGEITQLLDRLMKGDRSAEDTLMERVYGELHSIAVSRLRPERRDHTIQPTALVHEAYVRLCKAEGIEWKDREHFLHLASRIMRRFLIDYARQRQVRPEGAPAVSAEDSMLLSTEKSREALAVNDLLDELAALNERQAKVVEQRFFWGLSEREIAEGLGVDVKTVQRDWAKAKAWLLTRIKSSDENEGA